MITQKYWLIIMIGLLANGCAPSPLLPQHTIDDPATQAWQPKQEQPVAEDRPHDGRWVRGHHPAECDWERVEYVSDGDTLVTTTGERVRFVGIDTPETKKKNTPIQPFGLAASAFTKRLLPQGSRVCLIADQLTGGEDHYGRRLAYPFTEEGKDVTDLLVGAGLAKVYRGFGFERQDALLELEKWAKGKKLGRWGE